MPRVLVHPPAVAEADHEVPEESRDQFTSGGRGEDLLVRAVMREEGGLGEEHREGGRDEELPPGAAEDDEERDGTTEQCREERSTDEVRAGSTVEQMRRFDLPRKRRVGARVGRSGGAGVTETWGGAPNRVRRRHRHSVTLRGLAQGVSGRKARS